MKAKVWRTCEAFPSQWEGMLDNGKSIYIKYRHGKLKVGLGKTLSKAILNAKVIYESKNELDGFMTNEEMIKLVKEKMNLEVEVIGWRDI